MRMVGLTGGIASGKSTVSGMLRALGATVLDADAIYHELVAPRGGAPSPLARAIDERFGGVLTEDGRLDRGALGPRVFGDPQALAALGAITHPAVAAEVARRVAELERQGVEQVVYDVPLLFERGLEAGMEAVIVVWVPREVQLERLMAREGLRRADAERRVDSQMPLDEKRRLATHVIDNSGSLAETRAQVERVWSALRQS